MTVLHIGPTKEEQKKKRRDERWHRMQSRVRGIGAIPVLLAFAGLAAVGVVIATFLFYASHFGGDISSDSQKWADFGAFLGGAVTPVLSCLTFLGLLLTIYFQRRELGASTKSLDVVREELEQAKKASEDTIKFNRDEVVRRDLARALEIVGEEIQERFREPAQFSLMDENNFGFYFSFSAPSRGMNKIPQNGDEVSDHDRKILIDLVQLHSNLALYINDYEARFGNTAIVYHYKYRYMTLDSRLNEKGFTITAPPNPFSRVAYLGRAPTTGDTSVMP